MDEPEHELRLRPGFVQLTPREHDVLALLQRGLSNREISKALFISTATTASHVRSILSKLGVPNRTAAVAAVMPAASAAPLPRFQAVPQEPAPAGHFVGRAAELATLRDEIELVSSGARRLVLIAGEPGVGKTRLAQEGARFAARRGLLCLWGRNHEASGAPPYWQWLEAGRAYLQSGPGALQALALDSRALARLRLLFSEAVAPGVDVAETAIGTSPELARFQLWDAYAAFLRAIAARQPLFVVLEDLQWADGPSLQLLRHCARALEDSPLLVVGTYRDSEHGHRSPLEETLAALRRECGFERIVLGGLSRDDVAAYLQRRTGLEPSSLLVDELYEKTEGNPFFVGEIVQLIMRRNAAGTSSSSGVIPDGVRDALNHQLARLLPATGEVLRTAAIIGRDFTYGLLAETLGSRPDELVGPLEEALSARIIEEMPGAAGQYRFRHALVLESILAGMSSARRAEGHGRVGIAMERHYGPATAGRAAQLAAHFIAAAAISPAYRSPALHHSMAAGAQAEATYAWAEAARHYEACLKLSVANDQGAHRDRADMQLKLGRCLAYAGDWRRSWAVLMAARDAFRSLGDEAAAARTTLVLSLNIANPERNRSLLEDALRNVAGRDLELEARIIARLVDRGWARAADRGALIARARQLARALGLADVLATVGAVEATEAVERRHPGAEATAARAIEALVPVGQLESAAWLKFHLGIMAIRTRDLAAGEIAMREAFEFARRYGITAIEITALIRLTGLALARLDDRRFEELAALVAIPNFCIATQRAYRLMLAGRFEDAVGALPAFGEGGRNPMFEVQLGSGRVRVFHDIGQLDRARAEFAELMTWLDNARAAGIRYEQVVLYLVTEMDDSLLALASDDLLDHLYEISGQVHLNWDPVQPRSLARVRAQIALQLGKAEEARALFEQALAWASAERLPAEHARSLEGLGDVARGHGDLLAAGRYMDEASEIANRHGFLLLRHRQ